MKRSCITFAALCALFSCVPGHAQSKSEGADRLYVLDCGNGHAPDESRRWTPGFNIGKPIDISVSCYLIHHAQGYFLWDTGISDQVAALPNGWLPTNNAAVDILWTRSKTLMSQLKQLNVKPEDIKYIGISHTHPDHIGNVELFPKTTVLIQRAEYEFFFGPAKPGAATLPAEALTIPPGDPTPRFSKEHPNKLVDEDLDVFGDGSVMIVSTPGHTPGHESLLVHMRKTGWILLSGDAVHLADELGQSQDSLLQRHADRTEIPDAAVDAAHGRPDGLLPRATLDQSRSGANEETETLAGVLRIMRAVRTRISFWPVERACEGELSVTRANWNSNLTVKTFLQIAMLAALLLGATAAHAQYPLEFPTKSQVSMDGTAILMEDYANVPLSSLRGDGPYPSPIDYHEVLARPNTLVSEPSNAPASASRFFVNDLNGVLYILDKKTKKFIPYIVFPEVFPRMDTERFASGIVTIQFDPDYAHNGKFYTVHTESPRKAARPRRPMPNCRL